MSTISESPAAQAQKSPWVPDNDATQCFRCKHNFTVFVRRHHCRECGNVVCDSCSRRKAMCHGYTRPERACDTCFKRIVLRSRKQRSDSSASTTDVEESATVMSDERSLLEVLVKGYRVGALNLSAVCEPSMPILSLDDDNDYGGDGDGDDDKNCATTNTKRRMGFNWPTRGCVAMRSGTFQYTCDADDMDAISSTPVIQVGLAWYVECKVSWEPDGELIRVCKSAGDVVSRLDPNQRVPRPEDESVQFHVTKAGDYVGIVKPMPSMIVNQQQQHPPPNQSQSSSASSSASLPIENDTRQLWQCMVQAWKRVQVSDDDPQVIELQQQLHLHDAAVLAQCSNECEAASASHSLSVLTRTSTLTPYVLKTDSLIVLQGREQSLVCRTMCLSMFEFDDFPQMPLWSNLLDAFIRECSAKYDTHVNTRLSSSMKH